MFRSATIRLTASYLGIIMAISILFSFVLYSASNRELHASFHREVIYYQFDQLDPPSSTPPVPRPLPAPSAAYASARHRLQLNLITINIGILILAGGTAYLLARRTLGPIERALDAQSRFASDASHELRTPLTAMRSEIEVALRGKELSPGDARELLESNLEEVNRLEALSTGLLRLARQNQSGLDYVDCKVIDILTAATKRLGKQLKARSMKLELHIDADSVVKGDPDSLTELFVTLLDNAIKYSEPETTITLVSRLRGKMMEVDVADQGRGIPAVDLPHIFERFYRSDNSRSRRGTEGYGLGLSIARQIAELHHGSIHVTSQEGSGSVFTTRLPQA